MSEAGVIGYALRKSGSFDCTLAATSPSASAWFPVMFRYVPGGSWAGATSYCVAKPSARLAERVARLERAGVRLGDLRPLGELLVDEVDRSLGRARVQPRHEPEREHVLRALGLALRDAVPLTASSVSAVSGTSCTLELVERAVLERVRRVAGLLQVAVVERIAVDDQRPAGGQVLEVHPQRGRVHRDEDVRGVAGREDVVVGEVDLETGHPGQRARRSADLRREVGKRREVVSEERGLAREAAAGELHSVAGVAGEPDDDVLELLDGLGHRLVRRYSSLLQAAAAAGPRRRR